MTASDLLSQLLQQSPAPSAEQIGASVFLSLQESVNDPTRNHQEETTNVLHLSIAHPDTFVSIARNLPTSWIDFLSGSDNLWSKIIDQTVKEVLTQGANKPTPLFSLVRRWSHPQSIHSVVISQCSASQIYWETMQALALHPQGEEFITKVRTTKGPVRHWVENFHSDIFNGAQIDGVAVFEKLILHLPPTQASNSLWLWRMEKSHTWHKDFPSDKIQHSHLSPYALAYTIAKISPGSVNPSILSHIFSWKEPLKVIQEMKMRLNAGVFTPFVNSLVEGNLVVPMSAKMWNMLQKNPLEFFAALDASRHASHLMKEFLSPEPQGYLQSKHANQMVQFAMDVWTKMGRLPPTSENPWEELTVALHLCGLLPHVVLNSLDCFIESEDVRWNNVKSKCPDALKWAAFRPSCNNLESPPAKMDEDEKRMIMIKMVKNHSHNYHTFITQSSSLIPREMTKKQSHHMVQTLCNNIKWEGSPLQEIAWMAKFCKEIKTSNETDVRSLLLWSFLHHYQRSADTLSYLLTDDSGEGELLQKVLRASTSEIFPYSSTHERPFEQVVQKFLLMDAANYTQATSITKRKI